MNKNSLFSVVLLLISTFIFVSSGYSQVNQKTKSDSLRIELQNEKNKDKISTQLELALTIYKDNKQEALELAKSALKNSLKVKNKFQEINSYYTLGKITTDYDSIQQSENYYNKALKLSEENGENWYRGKILYEIGLNNYYTGDFINAIESFTKSIRFCNLSNNFKTIGSSYSMLGSIYRRNAIYDRAIEYFIKSGLNYKKASYFEGDAWVSYLLGRVYADLKNPKKALEYFQESLKNYQKISVINGNNNGIIICHEQIALINLESGNLEEAEKSINELLKLHLEKNSKYGMSNAYSLMGRVDYLKGNYEQAELKLNKSFELKIETNSLIGLPIIYEYLGLCLIKKGNLDEGFSTINKGLELAILNNQKKIQLDIYSKLSEVYFLLNNLEKVVFNQKKLIEIQNEIFFGVASIKMEQMQAFYEIDEKNQQLKELENQNKFNQVKIKQQKTYQFILVFGILIAILVSITIYVFYHKLRRKNKELETSNTTKNKLFSIIAHDLKGPIGTANELLGILLEATKNNNVKTVEKFVPLLHQSMNETYNLLDNLLEWANSQNQNINIKYEILPLYKIVTSSLKSVFSQAERKNINIIVEIDENIKVKADLAMLKTILRNLISNAIKFTNKQGEISISAIEKNNLTQICVKDNGIGISPESVKKLFFINTNFSEKGTSGEKGTGIGLILCYDFVKLHNGEIWVESILNEGSSFFFTLPN
jgi:signal transduction histidine kinase